MKKSAKLMANPSTALLAIVLSCLSIVAGFLWQQQAESERIQVQNIQQQRHTANIIHSAIEDEVTRLNTKMSSLTASPVLATTLTSHNPNSISFQQRQLHEQFPEAQQVCLIKASVDEPNPEACIPITFATLESLRIAKQKGAAPIGVMQTTQEDAYLLLTRSIKDSQNKVVGVLAVTLTADTVQQLIKANYSEMGYLEIQQGTQGSTALAKAGDRQWREGSPVHQRNINQSHWKLAYWPSIPEASNSYLLILAIVLAVTLFMWLLRERAQRLVVSHDLTTLKGVLLDLSQSQLKASYSTLIPDSEGIIDEIKRLGHIIPIQPKNKSQQESNETEQQEAPVESQPALNQYETERGTKVDFELPTDTNSTPSAPPVAELEPLELQPAESSIELAPAIFKAYDIRGIVGETIDEQVFKTIGQAIGSEALDRQQTRLVVARDGRLSSENLCTALVEGILASGCEVVDIGLVPTPLMLFACEHLNTHSGVMVTASHNPANYNGLKITLDGKPIFGAALQQLYQRILQGQLATGAATYSSIDVVDDYIAHVVNDVHLLKPLKIVVDCGNGVGGVVIPKLLTALGCEVIELYCDVDGEFPNHHPNPSEPSNLQDLILAVQRSGSELGLAFDGDGDRLGTVDAEGDIIWSDRLMILFAQDVLSRIPGAQVIYDVKSTSLLESAIMDAGGEPLMWQSGYALIRDKMQATGAPLAGEMTGHIFFKDRWFGHDDAIYSACRAIELVARDPQERSSTAIFADIPARESTPEIVVEMSEWESQKFIQQFVAEASFPGAKITTIDGLRADFQTGWGLVRASNTVPGIILRFEAETSDVLKEIQQQFKQQMLQVKPTITLLF